MYFFHGTKNKYLMRYSFFLYGKVYLKMFVLMFATKKRNTQRWSKVGLVCDLAGWQFTKWVGGLVTDIWCVLAPAGSACGCKFYRLPPPPSPERILPSPPATG